MLRDAATITLFVSLALVAYSYLAYPVLIWLLSRLFGRRRQPTGFDDGNLPSVSLLIAAHNEERWIGQRLENALDQAYPPGQLEILVASDGSTDATADIVRGYAARGVRLVDLPQNRGKATALNQGIAECRGELVVLSDANTFFDRGALGHLARWFAEPSIGAVCGRLVLTDPATGKNVDSLYWKYETFLKKCESRLGALLGANGAIYALRRDDYIPIPPDTIVDDFVVPLMVRMRTNRQIVYDAQAFAWEESPPEIGDEFRRRARIGAGGFQSLMRLWPLLSPTRGWIAFTLFSHKVLRWLCPFLLIVALVANVLCLDTRPFQVLLLAQLLFYVMALAGNFVPGSGLAVKLLRVPAMFASMNLALLCGFWRWISGRQRGVWQRTTR